MFDPHFLQHIPPVWAYAAIVGGTFLEGEAIVIIGGALAHEGYLTLPLVIVCALAGSLSSDQFTFTLGRRYGKPFLERRPALRERAMRATRLIDTHEALVIFGFRFLYGLRNIIPLMLGTRGVAPKKFFLFNLLGGIVWAISFSAAGYLGGSAINAFLRQAGRFRRVFLICLIGALLAWGALRLWRRFRPGGGPSSKKPPPHR